MLGIGSSGIGFSLCGQQSNSHASKMAARGGLAYNAHHNIVPWE
jgi:hypothetical protein